MDTNEESYSSGYSDESDNEMIEETNDFQNSDEEEDSFDEEAEQSFEEDSASDDDEFFEKQHKKESKQQQKKIEFEEPETKQKFIKTLNSILEGKSSGIMSKNKKLMKENIKLREKMSTEIKKTFDDKKIFNKDHKDPQSYSMQKENYYRGIATSGVVELFSAVQKSRKSETKKAEVASGYSSLKNSFAQDSKSKWNVLTDELIEDDEQ
eukprot:gene11238-4058_t